MSQDRVASLTQHRKALAFRLRNDRRVLVPIHLEALIVPNLGASIFSVGALHEKGVQLDLLSVPPVLRYGNHAFPISTEVPRMYLVHIVPDAQENTQRHILHNSGRRRVAPKDGTLSPARIETAS